MALSEAMRKRINQTVEKKTTGVVTSSPQQTAAPAISGKGSTGLSSAMLDRIHKNVALKRLGREDTEVDEDYINKFQNDYQMFLYNSQYDYDRMTWQSSRDGERAGRRSSTEQDLAARETAIRTWMDINRKAIGEEAYNNMTAYLDEFDSNRAGIMHIFDVKKSYFSQWETEADYNSYVADVEEYEAKVNFDLTAGEREISDLESILEEYRNLTRWTTDSNGAARAAQIRNQYGGEAEIQALISEKQRYLNEARHIQEGVKLSGVADRESQYYDPSFESKSGYVTTIDPDPKWWQSGVGDTQYEWINNQNGFRDEYESSMEDLNAQAGASSQSGFYTGPRGSEYYQKGYDRMTSAEVAIYNYYYSTEGKEKAQEFLDSIQEDLNHRKATAMFEGMEDKTFQELIFGVEAGLDQFKSGVASLINTEDDYIPQSAVQMASGMVREDLEDKGWKLPEWLGGASLGQAGYDIITTTANMAPSIMASTVIGMLNPVSGQVTGSALMGASAAGNAYQEMLNLGYNKDQARMYSALVGSAEAGLQYLLGGVGKLGGKLSGNVLTRMMNGVDNAFWRVSLSLAGNMAAEGIEEGLTEILTPWMQNLVMHTDEKADWSEVTYSTLLGALTAGFMEGPSTISEGVSTYKTGAQLKDAGISAQRLAEIGNTFAADTVAAQLAGKVNENTGAYTMGRLFNEIGATLTEQNVNDITNALIKDGMSSDIARKNAQAMAGVVEGGNLNDLQIGIIEANEPLARAVRTTIIDPNATWFQRTKGYNEALMALAKEKTSSASQQAPGQENVSVSDNVGSENENGTEDGAEAVAEPKAKSISAIKDGQVTVRMEDGSEVNLTEAGIAPDDGVRIETIAKIDGISVEDANHILTLLKAAPDVNPQFGALGAKEVYKYGFYGMPAEQISKYGVFASSLTETQRQAIYDTGRSAGQRQVDNKNATVAKKNATTEKSSATGRVHFDGDRSKLNSRRKASLTAMEKIAEVTGVQIYVFRSYLKNGRRVYSDKNGVEKTAPNGWYDPADSSIHIDLNAGANGEGTMLFTLAHELTHHIRQWSPAKFKVLADFLMEEYGKKGKNVGGLIREQMEKAKRGGRTISYDTAYEEMVADSMEAMLSDGNVLNRLEKLKIRDNDLWHEIKDFINKLADKIRRVYKRLTPDSDEALIVADMGKAVYRLQELFAEGLADASENYQASLSPGEEGVVANQNGDPVAYSTADGSVLLSMRTYEEDGRKTLRDYLEKCVSSNKLTKTEMQEMLDGIEEIYTVCKEFKDKYAPFGTWSDAAVVRDTYGKPVFSVVTPNGDYKMNLDFSLVCKKRRTLDAVFNEMSRRGIIDDFELGQKSVVKINEIFRKHGFETACALCFVDAKRFRQASMADSFTNLYNELVLSLVPEAQRSSIDHFNFSGYESIKKVEGGIDTWDASKLDFSHLDDVMKNYGKGTVEYKAAKYIKTNPKGRRLLLRGDFMSSKGFDAVKTQNKDILKLYNSKKGTGGPKAAFGDVQYMNEIVKKARTWTPAKAYSVGGVRIQSFSDYVPRMVFDYVQMIYDLAATGLPAHAYTKEALFVKQFGLTGVKINMSLIPAIAEGGVAPGLDADGNYVWAGESFDYDTAKEIQNAEGYTENCGTICVGVSDEHITKLLRDPNIRMVIPYHKSGLNPIVAHMNRIAQFTDYTNDQRTKGSDGKALAKDFDFSKALHDMGDKANPKAIADQYLKWCIANGHKPRFSQFAAEDNYYKLLEDFTLYDKDDNYVPQREVRAVFPRDDSTFGSMKSLVEAGLQEDAIIEGRKDARLSSIVDEIQNTLPKTEAEIEETEVKQADRDLEAAELSDTDIKYSIREEAPPKKVGVAYKVFLAKDGQLYPPMVANPGGEGTPVGVWLNADIGKSAPPSKTGRPQVQGGGKGTNSGKISLAFRPGWHLGDIPLAKQFAKLNPETGKKELFPANFVWAECEYAMDVDYQEEAMSYGYTENGKFRHSYAGLPKLPADGYYRYRTNPNPDTVPWVITGAMRVKRILTDAETDAICRANGVEPMARQGGPINLSDFGLTAGDTTEIKYSVRDFDSSKEKIEKNTTDLANMSPVYAVPASKLERTGKRPTDIFAEYFDSWGNNIYSDELGDIALKKSSIKSEVRHGITAEKIASIEAIPSVIKEGKVIFAGTKDGSDVQRSVVCAPITIGKSSYYMGVMLQRDTQNQRLYLHNVAIEKEASDISQADLLTTGADESNEYLFITNILQNALAVKYKIQGGKIRWSARDTESVSNRSLLANALETAAQNDIERNRLKEYRGKIDLINTEEQKLQELNEKIKELTTVKGPKDTKAIRDLRDEAIMTANRINVYDKQLLRLEASKPLQNVLDREKKMAYQRAEQKGKEALAKYRERATKTQRQMMDRYKESRERAKESREKTAMRHKIQNIVEELNNLLLHGDKKRHVPENLKKAVADALALVNMDTVGAEERAAKYAALIAKETDPDKIDAYTMTMENILRKGEKMGQRLKELRDAYEEFQKSDDPDIANAYDPVIAGCLNELSQSIGNTSLRNMSIEQLSDVYDMYRMVLTRVRDANKTFLNDKKEAISNLASRVVGEVRIAGGDHKYRAAILDPIKKFGWNNLKPVYAFEYIGSSTLTDAFDKVRTGEDVWAKDVTEAREFYLDKSKKYGYDSWDFKKKYRFESASEETFELTLEQILSLYAYSKRTQAHDHLKLGGFVFDSNIETYKEGGSKLLKYKVNTADAHQITPEILADIVGTLTSEQMSFVDEMQGYLSTVMGAKGNEITMQMYGVKLFKEKFYFPLKSAKQFMFEQNEVAGEVKIKNSGFTNKVVANANNPVILSNFMEVWANHVNDMSMYHAFVLPLEDFNRIFNYNSPKKEGQPPVSVKGTIQSAYTPAAVSYVKQLITDLNGGARTDSPTGFINKMMGLFKKGSVFASASVVVQQPSAIARAAALVDLKYFIGPKVDHKRHKLLWNEVKQYAPVAIIKEMGYFDTNMGKSTQDFIMGREYSGIKEKATALVKDSNYRDEILSKAPALADEMAWCSIWEAVKREMHDKHPGLDTRSEPFLRLAGARFTEVISKTQVYDSVLSRSANMRSKDTGMKMATAFMAEPTTSINMVADALLKAKRGNKRYCRKAIGAVIASQLLNSFLVAFVYAARDDDEEKSYWEKYIASFVSGVADGVNPATYIPFIKDIVSIVQGYEVERSDMAVISDLWTAWQQLKKGDVSAWRKVEGFVGSLCQIFGLPVKNIMRDVRAAWQACMSLAEGEKTTATGIKYAITEAITGESVPNTEQLYRARLEGDTGHESRVEARYDDEDSADAAVRAAIKDSYLNDEIDLVTARNHLITYAGMDVDDAHWLMDAWEYRKNHGSDDGYNKYNDFYEAVETGKNLRAVIQIYTENGVKKSTLSGQITEHYKPDYVDMSAAERANIKGYLLNAFELCGMTRADAEKKLLEWDFEAKHGFAYSDRKQAYLDGEVSASQLQAILVNEKGYEPEDAAAQIEVYEWEKDGIEGATVAAVQEYNEWCKPAGVSRQDYLHIRQFSNNTENDTDDSGEPIYYSAVQNVMAEIDSLNISDDQKTAIAMSLWKESTVNKYKLW